MAYILGSTCFKKGVVVQTPFLDNPSVNVIPARGIKCRRKSNGD